MCSFIGSIQKVSQVVLPGESDLTLLRALWVTLQVAVRIASFITLCVDSLIALLVALLVNYLVALFGVIFNFFL